MTEEQIRLCKATADSIMKITVDQTRRRDPKKALETLGIWYAFGCKHGVISMVATLLFLPPQFTAGFSAATRGIPRWTEEDIQSYCRDIAATQSEFTTDQFIQICWQFANFANSMDNKNPDLTDVLTWIDNHSH